MFHPHAFLSTVQFVYEHIFMQGPGEIDLLETEAFSKLLVSRTEIHDSDGTVLFRLFKGFITEPSTPRDRIVTRSGEEWLRISYLQPELRCISSGFYLVSRECKSFVVRSVF